MHEAHSLPRGKLRAGIAIGKVPYILYVSTASKKSWTLNVSLRTLPYSLLFIVHHILGRKRAFCSFSREPVRPLKGRFPSGKETSGDVKPTAPSDRAG